MMSAKQTDPRLAPRHWRFNVTPAGMEQIHGGYLWAPKRAATRAGQQPRSGITRILPGDVVFAGRGGRVIAVGIALERARSSPDPTLTSTDGWLVPTRFEMLSVDQRVHGRGSTQLVEVPDQDAQAMRQSFGGQVETFEERVGFETGGSLMEQAMEEQIWLRTDIMPGDKRHLSAARQGNGQFRANVERFEHGCRVTGVLDRRYLRAVHIKPWRDATDAERLDGANGLLLAPHAVQLFARGHMSFADDGTSLISKHLNPLVQKAWIGAPLTLPRPFRPEQLIYLDYHRTWLFEHVAAGRRTPGA